MFPCPRWEPLSFFSATYSQDACLWGIDDCRELLNAKHAQVGNSEGTALEFVWLQLLLLGLTS